MSGERDLARMLGTLSPKRRPGEFVFVTGEPREDIRCEAIVREYEGTTMVVERRLADVEGLPYDFVGAWITLAVHSALDAVGLTAAVSQALADAGIACNVLAGRVHDHLVVPVERSDEALEVLRGLGRA
jgi:uncharacterized protein